VLARQARTSSVPEQNRRRPLDLSADTVKYFVQIDLAWQLLG